MEKNERKDIHPYWKELMGYVEKNGGYMKLEIRFKDGLPIAAEEVRKQVRFDINYKNTSSILSLK